MDVFIADKNDIAELTQVEIDSKVQSISDCVENFEIDYAARQYRWQTYFKGESPQTAKPERIVFKAVDQNGSITGYVAGHLTERFNIDAEIQSFYILKEHQRFGLGTRLLKELSNWLAGKNAKSLCVGINPENKYKAFYLKHGGQYLNEHWIFWQDIAAFQDGNNITDMRRNT